MDPASDSLKYDLYPLEFPSNKKPEQYGYKKLQEKLRGVLFDCPNCLKDSVKISVGQELSTDIYLIRAYCYCCGAHSVMEVSSFVFQSANFDIASRIINDAVYALGNASELDLDAMIDEDWKLAGS